MDEEKNISLLTKLGFIKKADRISTWEKKEGPLCFLAFIGKTSYLYPPGLALAQEYYDGRVLSIPNFCLLGENPSEEYVFEYMVNVREEYGLGNPNIEKIKTAIQTNNSELLKAVIHKAPISLVKMKRGMQRNTFLHEVYDNPITEIFLSAGLDPNSKNRSGDTPLHTHKSAEAVSALINTGADLNSMNIDEKSPLFTVTSLRSMTILLKAGINIDQTDKFGKTALFYRVREDNIPAITLLLASGADPNLLLSQSASCLHYAKSVTAVNILTDFGAAINPKDDEGRNPLFYTNILRVANHLINLGCDFFLLDSNGLSPLHTASSVKMVEGFIYRGLNINLQDFSGKTPLHYAVIDNSIGRVKCLLNKGADVSITDNDENTALDLAKRANVEEVLISAAKSPNGKNKIN